MAALTAASLYNESMGSNTLYIINFTSVSSDTYTNLALGPQVIGYWARAASANILQCSLASTTGVFSLMGDTACAWTLYVVAKQC
jgi:hypothetical protein